MYGVLYESMIAWYARAGVASGYWHWYAITTMTSMGLVNIGSIVVAAAYLDFAWGKMLLVGGRPWPAALAVGIAVFAAHALYFRRRAGVVMGRSLDSMPSRWFTPGYIFFTVVVFMYVSPMAPIVLRRLEHPAP